MTTPCYPQGCAAALQVRRLAFWSSSPYDDNNAWNVNFNDGSVNNNNRNKSYAVRLVRASQWMRVR